MLHPEEAWPRRWVHRPWLLVGIVLLIALAAGAIVVALLLGAGGGDEAQPAGAPPTVNPPEAFQAEAAGLSVRLSWQASSGGLPVDHYDVYRNDTKLITLSDAGTTYVDDSVRPGKEYVYEIAARSKAKSSERVTATVTVSAPPLRSARVQGDFSVVAKTTSKSGYENYGPSNYGWVLEPKCGSGACTVTWRDLHEKGMRTVLKQEGARYSGTYSGFFFITCGGTRSTSTVKIDLKVANAKAVEGEWLATKLVGTLRQSEASQLGCVSSSATQRLTAKLVR